MCTTSVGRPVLGPQVSINPDAEPRLTIPPEPVDRITVTTLVDNVTDLLATDTGPAKRPFIGDAVRGSSSFFEEGWRYEELVAEHGFSALVTVVHGDAQHRILFDAGLSPGGLATNMARLGIHPGDVEAIVLSHGHADHTTGLDGSSAQSGELTCPWSSTRSSGTDAASYSPAPTQSSCPRPAAAHWRGPASPSSKTERRVSCSTAAC